jgi:hypothetical protein
MKRGSEPTLKAIAVGTQLLVREAWGEAVHAVAVRDGGPMVRVTLDDGTDAWIPRERIIVDPQEVSR